MEASATSITDAFCNYALYIYFCHPPQIYCACLHLCQLDQLGVYVNPFNAWRKKFPFFRQRALLASTLLSNIFEARAISSIFKNKGRLSTTIAQRLFLPKNIIGSSYRKSSSFSSLVALPNTGIVGLLTKILTEFIELYSIKFN